MPHRIVLVAATLLGAVLAPPGVLTAQTQPSWFGTWTLNLGRSTYSPGPPPFKRATRTVAPSGDEITIVDEMVRNRGGITHLEWTGKFDGKDYPVQGVELVLTNAYRRVDDRTYELIQRIDGEVVAISRLTMSPDGRTITTVNSSKTASATTVYDRR
jgi:hypothetical protein